MQIEPIERGWNLCILEDGEQSPLEHHCAFELAADELAADNAVKRIYGSAAFVRAMGLDSILNACRGYVAKYNRTN